MQSIINSIVKNRNLIIYLFLSFVTFNYLYNNSSVHYSGIGKVGTFISGSTSSIYSFINSYFNLRQENNMLIEENLELKKNESQFIDKSDTRDVSENKIDKTISAKVILNSINKSKNIIVINKGELNGITKEMGVISSKGVVGIIKNITDNYSSIVSLLNTDLKINAVLKNTSTIGSISWNGLDPRIVQLNDIPLSSSIKVGDTVVTGGMSFYFPKGIPIGRIEDYNNTSLEGYYSIDISIFTDFSSLSNLYILQRTDNDEIKSLLNE
jgi:rod shape-determining protein MreC